MISSRISYGNTLYKCPSCGFENKLRKDGAFPKHSVPGSRLYGGYRQCSFGGTQINTTESKVGNSNE